MTLAERGGPHQARQPCDDRAEEESCLSSTTSSISCSPGRRAGGALRVPLLPQPRGRPELARGHPADGAIGRRGSRLDRREQPLGDRGLHLERPAGARGGRRRRWPPSPRSSSRAWSPGRRSSATRAPTTPTTGSAAWPARTSTPSSSSSPATSRSASGARRSTGTRRALRGGGGALVARPGGDPAVRPRARPLRLPRPAVAAGHRGIGRRADARLRRPAEGGRVHPRLPRRGRQRGRPTRAGSPPPQRQLRGLPPIGGARRRVPRLPPRARRDARGAGADRREAHGPLAERGPAGPGAGQGRPGPRGRPAAKQRLQLQGDGPARVRRAPRGRTSAA